MAPDRELKRTIVADGPMSNRTGGMPTIVDGACIGVGSGTGDQDREVAEAAIKVVFGQGVIA